ncbi:hypothetical protein GGR57DRAFT_480452 [Xylariaceae sp. FL1272]|nr:hypothetical protein GGR57DRAFT_480452 [Xylariaceae sp. FL1272]
MPFGTPHFTRTQLSRNKIYTQGGAGADTQLRQANYLRYCEMNCLLIFALFAQWSPIIVQAIFLNITAIAGVNNRSEIQCWQMDTPFSISTDAGTNGVARVDLSDTESLSYLVLPSNYDGGLHNAPANQWVAFISGLVHITLPDDPAASAYVVGGSFGLIFAADTADVSMHGHITQYPGITETVGLQIPTKNNSIPDYAVLHSGPCTANEVAGIRSFASQ